MKTYFDWLEYNSKRNKEAIRIYNYNLKSKVNYIEKSFYKNVRDIYALSLLLAKKTNSISNVLDYGSNLIPHTNLLNKIDVSKYKFFIYNPLINKINKRLKLKFEFVNKIKDLKKNRFDLVYFGSSLQYIQNLNEIGAPLAFSCFLTLCHCKMLIHRDLKEEKTRGCLAIRILFCISSVGE